MSTSGLKFGDAQLGAIFFHPVRAAVHGERREGRRRADAGRQAHPAQQRAAG